MHRQTQIHQREIQTQKHNLCICGKDYPPFQQTHPKLIPFITFMPPTSISLFTHGKIPSILNVNIFHTTADAIYFYTRDEH